jgi:L-threonylcarbamoyladenylate synthase
MKLNQSNIKKAKKFLYKGGCIAIPTETVYGLAANAYSGKAVNKIFKLKKRPRSNPLIVHYSKISKLKKDCLLNENFLKLYKKFSPGPITFILKLKKNSQISKSVTNNKETLAVRFPRHKILKELLNQINFPLAAPSANISNRLSSVQASDVKDEFGKKIDFILNGGRSKIGLESTIIDLTEYPKILRLGGLEISRIKKILGNKIKISINVLKKTSPGQSRLHYSPGIPVRINVLKPRKNEAYVLLKKRKINFFNYFYLSKKNDLKEAAKNLYSCLRKIKNDGYKFIAVEKIPNKGLGKTINDRLIRASKH